MKPTIDAILFDLDNTLYDARAGLQDEGDRRIALWIMEALGLPREEADELRVRTWKQYGTTAQGLLAEHGIPPHVMYERCISPIDPTPYISPSPELDGMLADLTVPKHVFTNSTETYARNVLRALGVEGRFDNVFDIAYCDWLPKPNPASYDRIIADLGLPAERTVFVEDNTRNLAPAIDLGMFTVLISPDAPRDAADIVLPSILDLGEALALRGIHA